MSCRRASRRLISRFRIAPPPLPGRRWSSNARCRMRRRLAGFPDPGITSSAPGAVDRDGGSIEVGCGVVHLLRRARQELWLSLVDGADCESQSSVLYADEAPQLLVACAFTGRRRV